MNSYSQSVKITGTKEEVFDALTLNIDKWWGVVDQPASELGTIFKVSFGEAFWVFKVIDFKKNNLASWECVESNQVHAGLKGIKEEWLGTKLFWNLQSEGDKSVKVNFTHEGLVPNFNCYDVCSKAWDYFITDSLKAFVENGIGKPEK